MTKCLFHLIMDSTVIIVIQLKLLKFKYINNYMLIYVNTLNSSDHLDILPVDAYMPTLHTL